MCPEKQVQVQMENETVQIQSVFSIKAWDASTSDVVVKMLVANHVPSMLNEQLFFCIENLPFSIKKKVQ